MEIMYSDKNITVCVKPVGLDSEQEVPQALKDTLGGEIFPLHRLDKNVGGIMVFARTKTAAAIRVSIPAALGSRVRIPSLTFATSLFMRFRSSALW